MHYIVWRDFLSGEDCDKIIALAKTKGLQPTKGVYGSGQAKQTEFATCSQTTFWLCENPIVMKIENRIAEATGTPLEYGEGLRLVYYPEGSYMGSHYDQYNTKYESNQKLVEQEGNRQITFMVYLNDVPEGGGGETNFFDAGFKIRPEKGKALVFWNFGPNGEPDPSTHHEALALKPGHEKWIFTKWIHEKEFI